MPTVFITGASRGIGRAAALLFAGQGYLTAVNYNRSEAEALSLIDKIRSFGGHAVAIQGDVSDFARCAEMRKKAEELVIAKEGQHSQRFLHVGRHRRKLRGSVLRLQGGGDRSHQGSCKGDGALGNTR